MKQKILTDGYLIFLRDIEFKHYTDNEGIIHCNLIEFLLKPEIISL